MAHAFDDFDGGAGLEAARRAGYSAPMGRTAGGDGGAGRGGLLLEPVIADSGASPVRLYSLTASFMVAFFGGGGLPIILLSAMNSQKLRRLNADLWLYILGATFFAALTVVGAYAAATGTEIPVLQVLGEGSRGHRAMNRALALLFFGAVYLRHRRFHRAANLMGLDPLNPWGAAIGAIVAGSAMIIVVAAVTVLAVRPLDAP